MGVRDGYPFPPTHLHTQAQKLVGVGKHVCGAATDLAIRCMLSENTLARAEACAEASTLLP